MISTSLQVSAADWGANQNKLAVCSIEKNAQNHLHRQKKKTFFETPGRPVQRPPTFTVEHSLKMFAKFPTSQ